MNKDNFDKYLDGNDDDDFSFDDEYEDEYEHKNKKSGKTFTRGFLTALTICLVAIGAAVWTTVNNVNTYLHPNVSTESFIGSSDTDNDISNESSAGSEPENQAVAANIASDAENTTDTASEYSVKFIAKPMNTEILQDYSEDPVYNSTLKDYRAHPAIDYAANVDDKVRCMGNGTVTDIYNDEMLGYVAVVKHSDNVESYYCGLARTVLVQVGDKVTGGDFIGTVYSIPSETAEKPHVHIAVKENGQWVNPEKFYKTEIN